MSKYELILILPGEALEDKVLSLNKKVKGILTSLDSKVTGESDWGVKKLSYPVKQQRTGHYFLWQIDLEEEKIKEARRLLNFEQELLRYMLLKVEAKKV